MPKLICSTHSSNDYYNGDCDWLVIDISPGDANRLLYWMERVKAFKAEDGTVYCIELWKRFECYSTQTLDVFNEEWMGAATETDDIYQSFVPFPIGDTPAFEEVEGERVDCGTIRVTEDTCQWTCLVKHGTTEISSVMVCRQDIEAWAAAENTGGENVTLSKV